LGTLVGALSFEETVARAREPMTQRGAMVQVSLNVAKLVKSHNDAVLREDVSCSDIIRADGRGIQLAGRLLGVPLPARVARRHRPYVRRARRARGRDFVPIFSVLPPMFQKKPWRLRAIGTALGGKPRRLLPPGRGSRRGGRDSKVAGRLSVCRHAGAAEGACSRLGVHRNILDVPFKTYQRETDG